MSLLRPVDCPKCGAPLPTDAIGASVVSCPFCDATLAGDRRVVWAERYLRARAARGDPRTKSADRIEVAGTPYIVEGLLAHGEIRDVHLARRAHEVTERVVLKVLREKDRADLHEHEWHALESLHASEARGASHFTQRLPQLVSHGVLDDVPVSVFRFASGFVHTLHDVLEKHGDALDPRHAVWIWRRMLELLTWVHEAGWSHGAIVPEHVLVNARDHGVQLVGWTKAVRIVDQRSSAESDVARSARCISTIVSSTRMPASLAALVRTTASDGGEAPRVERELTSLARMLFGPPSYVRLDL